MACPRTLGASGHALRADGVADALRAATHGRARSIVIGLKARAACLMAGRRPELAILVRGRGGRHDHEHRLRGDAAGVAARA